LTDETNSRAAPATLGGRYVLERRLDGGGMADVYLAEDLALGRRVAVKVLKPELAADRDLLDEAEFARVAQLMTGLVACADGTDAAALKAAIDRLSQGTEEFAARRMDRSIRAALAGRRVDDVLAK